MNDERLKDAVEEIAAEKPTTNTNIEIPDSVQINEHEKGFQEAVEKAAEERARSPFEVACMQHARMYQPFIQGLDNVSGGAAKRILRYLVGYPFFVDKLNPQDKHVEQLAYIADKLGQAKSTILLIQAMEQEAKAMQDLAKHAEIKELDLEGKNEDNLNNSTEGE